ncbi:MAG: hypothetical protein IJW21_04395, partial [Clostridia bacterium]|nr:hypothetical protein [Clostridia bacterium]
ILYVFLPPKYYFGIMKYEKYIMIGMLVLVYIGVLDVPLNFLVKAIYNGMASVLKIFPFF